MDFFFYTFFITVKPKTTTKVLYISLLYSLNLTSRNIKLCFCFLFINITKHLLNEYFIGFVAN